MKRLALLLVAGVIASPAFAQSHEHHAGHEQPPAADPHAGHQMPEPAADPHAGHQMPEPNADPHAGHGATAPAPPVGPPPPEALTGPEHAADKLFGSAQMGQAREELRRHHGDLPASKLLVDRLEWRTQQGREGYLLDAQAWHGGDLNKLWLKTELEGERGRRPDHAEAQALWSHAIDPWFDLQTGVRLDANRGPNRAHLVLGVQGLAPYWWEVDAALFLSNKGELTARVEAEYDLRITQKLILQPRVEADLSAQTIDALDVGTGLSSADVGLRLRYQVTPTFAPYVGLSFERAFGQTRDLRRSDGEDTGGLGLLAGVRFWF